MNKITMTVCFLMLFTSAAKGGRGQDRSILDCSQCHMPFSLVRRGDPVAGEGFYRQKCLSCHGSRGVSSQAEQIPSLSGQQSGYLVKVLQHYRACARAGDSCNPAHHAGQRKNQFMNSVTLDLSDHELTDVVAYLAEQDYQVYCGQPGKPVERYKKNLYIRYCGNCHGGRGLSHIQDFPNLAFQSQSYLLQAYHSYRTDPLQQKRNAYHMEEVYRQTPLKLLEPILDYLTSVTLPCHDGLKEEQP